MSKTKKITIENNEEFPGHVGVVTIGFPTVQQEIDHGKRLIGMASPYPVSDIPQFTFIIMDAAAGLEVVVREAPEWLMPNGKIRDLMNFEDTEIIKSLWGHYLTWRNLQRKSAKPAKGSAGTVDADSVEAGQNIPKTPEDAGAGVNG